ncbi:hypothetical protein HanIR_Chr06g0287641 [Helianthus annuus]|nr:hypothetical protein HanIR_Chr06g0287641 [Helianthus annuus]
MKNPLRKMDHPFIFASEEYPLKEMNIRLNILFISVLMKNPLRKMDHPFIFASEEYPLKEMNIRLNILFISESEEASVENGSSIHFRF